MSTDVLEEAPLGLGHANESCDGGPEVAGVVLSESLPGVAEWLARVAANDDIHDSTPCCRIEGS